MGGLMTDPYTDIHIYMCLLQMGNSTQQKRSNEGLCIDLGRYSWLELRHYAGDDRAARGIARHASSTTNEGTLSTVVIVYYRRCSHLSSSSLLHMILATWLNTMSSVNFGQQPIGCAPCVHETSLENLLCF